MIYFNQITRPLDPQIIEKGCWCLAGTPLEMCPDIILRIAATVQQQIEIHAGIIKILCNFINDFSLPDLLLQVEATTLPLSSTDPV